MDKNLKKISPFAYTIEFDPDKMSEQIDSLEKLLRTIPMNTLPQKDMSNLLDLFKYLTGVRKAIESAKLSEARIREKGENLGKNHNRS